MESRDELRAARRKKLEALRARGVQPYGGKFPKLTSIRQLVDQFQERQTVITAGRLRAIRAHGGMTFADLRDASGKVQVCFRQEHLGDTTYHLLELLDLGDWLGVEGTFFKTRTGEVTITVDRFTVLSKSLEPLPEKWHGLKDVELRYRKRYVDLIVNEPVRRVFEQRAKLLGSLRSTLERHGYLEVETPMMHAIPGGAAGEPFTTHHNALGADLYLRLAPELHLKRLLVGGFEKVYELNRSFRNEGLSTRHNPEFTMLEAYCALEDYTYMMTLVEELICEAAQATWGSLQFQFQEQTIDLSQRPWGRVPFDVVTANLGVPASGIDDIETLRKALAKQGHRVTGLSRSQLVRLVEQGLDPDMKDKPLFVIDYWTELSPLAKSCPDRPHLAERFELFIGGMEVANAYSELNDPDEQRRRFEAQVKDQRHETRDMRPKTTRLQSPVSSLQSRQVDEDFLEALEYGMPPATGLGVGIDRLCMLLCNQASIKDVILFPLLKPEASD